MLRSILKCFALIAVLVGMCPAQGPSDAEIREAVSRGESVPAKRLWEEIKKMQQYRLYRAGFGDPI